MANRENLLVYAEQNLLSRIQIIAYPQLSARIMGVFCGDFEPSVWVGKYIHVSMMWELVMGAGGGLDFRFAIGGVEACIL